MSQGPVRQGEGSVNYLDYCNSQSFSSLSVGTRDEIFVDQQSDVVVVF
jgi:hypothetical protein